MTATEFRTDETTLGWRATLLLLIYGCSLYLINLGDARVLTHHEVFFAEPAREMLLSGEWLMTPYGGMIINHKPPLTYWVIAAAMTLFQSSAEWVIRLPFVLATVGLGLLMAHLGAHWFGRRIAILTGLIQLTAFYTLMQGRLAESDILLTFFVAAAMVLFAEGALPGPTGEVSNDRWRRPLFFLMTALAFMTKGPIAIIFIGGGCGLTILLTRQWRSMRFFISPLGWLFMAAFVVGWPLAAYLKDPNVIADWKRHNLDRFAGKFGEPGGHRPFAFYFYVVPLLLMPWTPFLAYGLWASLREKIARKPQSLFLWSWALVGILFLSLSDWKHKHYCIPVLPPLSVLMAYGVERCFFDPKRWRLPVIATISLLLIGEGVGIAIVSMLKPEILAAVALLATALVAGASLAVVADKRSSTWWSLGAIFGATWVVAALVQSVMMPHFDSYRDQTILAHEINKRLPDGRTVHMVDLRENQISFYLRWPIHRTDDADLFCSDRVAASTEDLYVVGPRSLGAKMAEVADVQTLTECATLRRIMSEEDRLTLYRVTPTVAQIGSHETPSAR
ncbi:Undecaprenyl phosphate-alpha-4-amino-4-deoxy-L-arabinose arabinosyl transferase [Planctomycetes bacterium Pan216]|uniref:Undecaprenyl phosphate-alpha-4-amino-4-deoxy-L-arabinose arabinosyl transferase n=1 Tax=Kolteria novifilia TaxID=2527975 RepID=A0A518BC90_9BACT|nr:Undecaprenyl phosphate-alpha-4-amino-4-deoxy-L-arabinose arabinosyl transferase [Planctomycetes bacterium Pan216]